MQKKHSVLVVSHFASRPSRRRNTSTFMALALLTGILGLTPKAATAQALEGNTPRFVSSAPVLGREDASKVVEVSLWLHPRNRGYLDELAKNLYDPKSPHFRRWLTSADIATRFAPGAADVKTVSQFLESHNLRVISVGPHNFFVRARGSVGEVETAFHVTLFDYDVKGKTVRANSSDPYLEGAVAPLVRHISGLDSGEFVHPIASRPTSFSGRPKTAANIAAVVDPDAGFFESECFTGTKTEKYTTGGTFPTASFTGNNYFSSQTAPGCGYTPPEIQAAYNLTSVYKEGFDGTGQTIVIIDWCGSPTIRTDANVFSKAFGLPALTPANFKIIEVPRPSTCAQPSPEINIDVEWAHAIAPGANIDLVVPPSATFQDVNQAEFYAVNYGLGSVISGSYGSQELYTATAELDTENLINEIAAIQGISANFSSGDGGDFSGGGFLPATVSAPADSPWATAVGGVALALNDNNSIKWQTGWGNNVTELEFEAAIDDPPFQLGFNGGSGGGPSGHFAKPSYQSSLPGAFRQLPDISWLADPFTGGVIAITQPNQFPPVVYQVWGGTSLACPMFSGLWAIANQAAGAPLGLASPYLYTLPANTITDILPYNSSTDVSGTIRESSTISTHFSATDIGGVAAGAKFYSAFWDYPFDSFTTYVLTFGTDFGLTTTKGWDNVTGLGTPNSKAFVDAFKPPKK